MNPPVHRAGGATFDLEGQKLARVADLALSAPDWEVAKMTFVSPAISLAIDTLAAYNKPVVDRLKEVQVMCKPSVISGWGRPSAAKVQVVESLRELVACLLGQLETYRIMTARDKESLKLEKEMSLTSLALGGGPMTLDQLTPGGFAFPAGLMPHGGGSTQFGSQAWDTNHFAAGGGGGSFSSAGASGYGRGGSFRGRNPFPTTVGVAAVAWAEEALEAFPTRVCVARVSKPACCACRRDFRRESASAVACWTSQPRETSLVVRLTVSTTAPICPRP